MSKDYQDVIWRLEPDSDIIRIYPNATAVIYAAGTTTPIVWSGNADQFGVLNITTLPTGWYDVYVGGIYYKSFNHVTADYVTKLPETWQSFIPGSITGDVGENENHEIFYAKRNGKILGLKVVVAYADATANATIHLLKGTTQRSAVLTFPTDSIWSVQCNPGQAVYAWCHNPEVAIAIEAQRVITTAIDWTAGTLKGVGVTMIFKAD